jgi:hypothetical protein
MANRWLIAAAGLCVALLSLVDAALAAEPGFALASDPHGKVLKTPDGRPVFRYMTKRPPECKLTANSLCCFHPIYTPSGQEVTALAPNDHRHHRGAFLAWYLMEGAKKADFWGWGKFAPTKGRVIENRSVELVAADGQRAELRIRNDWVAEGEAMAQEELRVAARRHETVYVIDLTYRLTPTVETKLAQSAFGGFCVRFRKDGKCSFSGPNGEVKLPNPHYLKPKTCWPAADWYDYSITLADGKTVGLAVIDHPKNPRTAWHNNRGVWMLNPCITAPGPITMKKGEPLVLRYRLVPHDGPTPAQLLGSLATEWRRP